MSEYCLPAFVFSFSNFYLVQKILESKPDLNTTEQSGFVDINEIQKNEKIHQTHEKVINELKNLDSLNKSINNIRTN
mgnify:CR=1 FL=1